MNESILHARYCEHYRPLVQSFAQELASVKDSALLRYIPELFLPSWGKHYEMSLTKLVVLGRDTYGWGSGIPNFLDQVQEEKWNDIFNIDEFQNLNFLDWGANRRYTFFGFVLYFLAWLYGVENWEYLKQGKHLNILHSFAWGNANSIERWDSPSLKKVRAKIPKDEQGPFGRVYDCVKRASRVFDDYRHLEEILAPDVVFATCQKSDCDFFLSKSNPKLLQKIPEADLWVYEVGNALIVNIPHPMGIMYRSDDHKADYYAKELRRILEQYGKILPMKDEFVKDGELADDFLNFIQQKLDSKTMSTRDAVVMIASELRKQDACMTVPFLCRVLNQSGFRTNWGYEYSGGRGSYRMLSWFYWHYKTADPVVAEDIARAFKRANGSYAYE